MVINQEHRVKILSKLYEVLDVNNLHDASRLIIRIVDWGSPNSLLRVKVFLWKVIKDGCYYYKGSPIKVNVYQMKRAYEELVRIAKRYGADL